MSINASLLQSLSTACEHGSMCVHDRPGHSLSAIQLRLALATPSGWNDAVVLDTDSDGWITLATLDGELTRVWHHSDVSDVISPGEPVAVHGRYGVLASGSLRLNVAR